MLNFMQIVYKASLKPLDVHYIRFTKVGDIETRKILEVPHRAIGLSLVLYALTAYYYSAVKHNGKFVVMEIF